MEGKPSWTFSLLVLSQNQVALGCPGGYYAWLASHLMLRDQTQGLYSYPHQGASQTPNSLRLQLPTVLLRSVHLLIAGMSHCPAYFYHSKHEPSALIHPLSGCFPIAVSSVILHIIQDESISPSEISFTSASSPLPFCRCCPGPSIQQVNLGLTRGSLHTWAFFSGLS